MAWPKILNPLELLKEIGVVAVFDAVKERLKTEAGREVVGQVLEKVKKSLEESRAELMAFVIKLGVEEPTASKNLKQRQEDRQLLRPRNYGKYEPYKYGDETKYVNLLTKLYKALDEPEEEEERKEVFKFLGHMPDEEFDTFLEFLNHDIVIQWIKMSWVWVKEIWQAAYPKGRDFLKKRITSLLGYNNITEVVAYSRQREQALRDEIAAQQKKGRWRQWRS